MDEDEGREREERICVERVKGPDLNTGKGNGPNPKQPSQGEQTLSLSRSGPPITQQKHAAMSATTRRTLSYAYLSYSNCTIPSLSYILYPLTSLMTPQVAPSSGSSVDPGQRNILGPP